MIETPPSFADTPELANDSHDLLAEMLRALRLTGDEVVRPSSINGMGRVNHGGGGEQTRMVCGFIESSEFLFAPVFRTLPPMLVDQTGDDKVSALITSTVREILLLADAAAPGSELMLGRLMELLL